MLAIGRHDCTSCARRTHPPCCPLRKYLHQTGGSPWTAGLLYRHPFERKAPRASAGRRHRGRRGGRADAGPSAVRADGWCPRVGCPRRRARRTVATAASHVVLLGGRRWRVRRRVVRFLGAVARDRPRRGGNRDVPRSVPLQDALLERLRVAGPAAAVARSRLSPVGGDGDRGRGRARGRWPGRRTRRPGRADPAAREIRLRFEAAQPRLRRAPHCCSTSRAGSSRPTGRCSIQLRRI